MPHVKNTAKGDGTPDFEVGHGDAVGVGVESERIKKGSRNASIAICLEILIELFQKILNTFPNWFIQSKDSNQSNRKTMKQHAQAYKVNTFRAYVAPVITGGDKWKNWWWIAKFQFSLQAEEM